MFFETELDCAVGGCFASSINEFIILACFAIVTGSPGYIFKGTDGTDLVCQKT